jgi:hypothetical protein
MVRSRARTAAYGGHIRCAPFATSLRAVETGRMLLKGGAERSFGSLHSLRMTA